MASRLILRPRQLRSNSWSFQSLRSLPRTCAAFLPRSSFTTQTRKRLARVESNIRSLSEVSFTSSFPHQNPSECGVGNGEDPKPDERTLKLGRTLRTLQSRMPTLLQSPLPQEMLSPHITLHLFPSTHPHLPTVSGRVGYFAALWTAPVAWGRVPIVGNVGLDILSERMDRTNSARGERLVVRWRTKGKTKGKGVGAFYRGIGASEQVDKITEWLGGDVSDQEEFTGLFVFEFDEEGRVLKHTIEHAEEGSEGEVGRVIGLTDWLLGRIGRKRIDGELVLGYCEHEQDGGRSPRRR